jgi:hypothetical protein
MFMVAFLVGALFVQCSDEEYASGVRSDVICFGSPELGAWQSGSGNSETRGTIVTTNIFANLYPKYEIYAWVEDASNTGTYIPYIKDGVVDSKTGRTECDYYWPGASYNLYFCGFAPAGAVTNMQFDGKLVTADYEVPENVTEQMDLLGYRTTSAISGEARTEEKSVSFTHILTAVEVKFADEKHIAGVASVTFENVYSSGTYSCYITKRTSSTWKTSELSSFTSDNKSGEYIANGDYTFLMIPQNFKKNEDAALVVKFDDGRKIRKSLSETSAAWSIGHRVVYTINYEGAVSVFDVPEAVDARADATSIGIHVVSEEQTYSTDDDGNTVAESGNKIDWTVESMPEWLTVSETMADSVTFNITEKQLCKKGDDEIQKRPPVTNYDLSGGSQNMSTANCYIVNQAGSYKFPLVYGNAINNGAINQAAYTGNGFVNHLGNAITSPYIYKNEGCTPASVKLLWQDKEGMIRKVGLSTDRKYITFETEDAGTIGQGNAVIAVCDAEGTIMWSWHIWVTYYIPNQDPVIGDDWRDKEIIPRETGTKSKYVIMPLNLGWCDKCEYYDGCEGEVTLKQTGTEVTKKVKVILRPVIKGTNGSQPHYQWCRKDPFLPYDASRGFENDTTINDYIPYPDKLSYDIDGTRVEIKKDDTKYTMQKAIQNPDVFLLGSNYKIWTGDTPWQYNYKTIYDPSPVGYRVVEREALSVMTTEIGSNIKISSGKINTPFTKGYNTYKRYIEVHEANGWVFYCYPKVNGKVNPAGGTFFLPTSLFRQFSTTSKYAGQVLYDNTSRNEYYGSGTVWVVVDNNNTSGSAYNLAFMGHFVSYNTNSTQRLYGRAIRCMKE